MRIDPDHALQVVHRGMTAGRHLDMQLSEEESNPLIALIESARLHPPILVTNLTYDGHERFCTMQVLSERQGVGIMSFPLYLAADPMHAASQVMMCVTDAARRGIDVTLACSYYVKELWPWVQKKKRSIIAR